MSVTDSLREAIEKYQDAQDIERSERLDSINNRYEVLVDRGVLERQSYDLASSGPFPSCLYSSKGAS